MPLIRSPLRDQIADWLYRATIQPPRYFSLKDAEAALPSEVYRQLVSDWQAYEKLWWGCWMMLHEIEYKNPETLPFFEYYKESRLRYSLSLEHNPGTREERKQARLDADVAAANALAVWITMDVKYKIHFDVNVKYWRPYKIGDDDIWRSLPQLKSVLKYLPETPSEIGTALQILIRTALEAELARLDKLVEDKN